MPNKFTRVTKERQRIGEKRGTILSAPNLSLCFFCRLTSNRAREEGNSRCALLSPQGRCPCLFPPTNKRPSISSDTHLQRESVLLFRSSLSLCIVLLLRIYPCHLYVEPLSALPAERSSRGAPVAQSDGFWRSRSDRATCMSFSVFSFFHVEARRPTKASALGVCMFGI